MANDHLIFGECAQRVSSTVQPEHANSARYIGLEHIEQGSLHLSGYGVSDNVTSTKATFSKGDILFGKLRPYFRKVVRAPFEGVCSTDIWVVRAGNGIDQGFLFYWMASQEFVDFSTQGSEGTKMPRAKWDHVSRHRIPFFSFGEQRAIAHILGTLDDKIELNRQLNHTLEAIARAIFKSWFVDFDPVWANMEGRPYPLDPDTRALFPATFEDSALGDIPAGWSVRPIGEVVDAVGGGTPSTKEPYYWEGGTHYFATPKDMSHLSSPILLATERKVTDDGLARISSGLLPPGTVLMSSRAPVGYLALAAVDVCINQGFIAIKPNGTLSNYYVLNWLHANMPEIKSRASGTTFPEISKRNFRPLKALVPDLSTVSAFDRMVGPLYEAIESNLKQTNLLADLRDTLLPRLISGELPLPAAAELVEEVAA